MIVKRQTELRTRVFHILSRQAAEAFKREGSYTPLSLSKEGFIHLSYAEQLCRVADFLYKGRDDLLLLEFDASHLPHLISEPNPGSSENFPHHYGSLNWQNVQASYPFPRGAKGHFKLPELD